MLFAGNLQQQSKRPVYRIRVWECPGNVLVEKHYVRSRLVRSVMLAANAAREVVLWPKLVSLSAFALTHTFYVPWARPPERG